mmetsp:Transcript_3800/g.5306  ORF Transcript_3800/g.5306 Transcript_3800/m.5306 type:complete len:220 (+) Transcript_3800:193-852(+)
MIVAVPSKQGHIISQVQCVVSDPPAEFQEGFTRKGHDDNLLTTQDGGYSSESWLSFNPRRRHVEVEVAVHKVAEGANVQRSTVSAVLESSESGVQLSWAKVDVLRVHLEFDVVVVSWDFASELFYGAGNLGCSIEVWCVVAGVVARVNVSCVSIHEESNTPNVVFNVFTDFAHDITREVHVLRAIANTVDGVVPNSGQSLSVHVIDSDETKIWVNAVLL